MNTESMKSEIAPTTPSNWDEPLAFRVWANNPAYIEDPKPWHVVAAFDYLLEALDYLEYCANRNAVVAFQSPTGVKLYK